MASIGKLISAVAEAEGMDEGSVKLIARYAREAGHISQGTYGPGAAKMTVRDAANLIIAVNAAGSAKSSANAIDQFRDLRTYYDPNLPKGYDNVEIDNPLRESVNRISSCNSFGTFLEALLDEYCPNDGLLGSAGEEVSVSVGFQRPYNQAKVLITKNFFYNYLDAIFVENRDENNHSTPNRTDETRITGNVLKRVARVIFD